MRIELRLFIKPPSGFPRKNSIREPEFSKASLSQVLSAPHPTDQLLIIPMILYIGARMRGASFFGKKKRRKIEKTAIL
jgi:hypothetical protein